MILLFARDIYSFKMSPMRNSKTTHHLFWISLLTKIRTQPKLYYRYWASHPLPSPLFSLSSINPKFQCSLSRPLQRALPAITSRLRPTPYNSHYCTAYPHTAQLSLFPSCPILSLHYSAKPPTHCSSVLHIPSINFCNNPLY